jgi:drug/metabolite transporter (DMT)-like permease
MSASPVFAPGPVLSPFAQTLRGIALVVVSQFAFIVNDTFVKLASETLPMGEVVFLRGLFCAILVGLACLAAGSFRHLPLLRHRMVAWRLVGELGGTFFFVLALVKIPIANATIIFQAVPLSVTAGAALFLGEVVGWRRWLAILIGFAGVLIVVRPGLAGFDAYGLFVLVSVLFVTLRDLVTRALPREVPTLLVTLTAAVAVAVMGALQGLTERWIWPDGLLLFQLLAAAAFVSVGYITIIAAMRVGDMSVTAPFRYVVVVFAIAIGFLVWGDVPDWMTLLGTAIIVGSGLYTLYRERQRRLFLRSEPASALPPA